MTGHTDDPPIIEIGKNGYVDLFDENGDPISLPTSYVLAVADAVNERREELEVRVASDRWAQTAGNAVSIVKALGLTTIPTLNVQASHNGAVRCDVVLDSEDDLFRVEAEFDAPIMAEPRYFTAAGYEHFVELFAYVADVRLVAHVSDVDLGAALTREQVSA